MIVNKEELKQKYQDEQVLCVKNFHLNTWTKCCDSKIQALLNTIKNHGYFDFRHNAEIDFEAKQVIPYVVLKYKDKYFVTERIKGDSRLVGGLSIAVGGHINPCDMKEGMNYPWDMIVNCMERELTEETTIDIYNNPDSFETITTFVDESAEVSKVHVCVLILVELTSDAIEIKETDKLKGQWMSVEEIEGVKDRLEGWSSIALEILNHR